jgi:hypothetical protein
VEAADLRAPLLCISLLYQKKQKRRLQILNNTFIIKYALGRALPLHQDFGSQWMHGRDGRRT